MNGKGAPAKRGGAFPRSLAAARRLPEIAGNGRTAPGTKAAVIFQKAV